MAQQLHYPGRELYFGAILLMLSYVMSSAPRYVREWRETHEKVVPAGVQPRVQWKKVVSAYTVEPYSNAWKALMKPDNVSLAERTMVKDER